LIAGAGAGAGGLEGQAARAAGMRAHASPSLAAAVKSVAKPESRVLICGSLYLAGRVLEENG